MFTSVFWIAHLFGLLSIDVQAYIMPHAFQQVSSDETIAIEEDFASYVDELQTALAEGDYANVAALCARITPLYLLNGIRCERRTNNAKLR